MIVEGGPENASHPRRLYRRLEQSGYASRYPEAVATLLQHLLPHTEGTWQPCRPVATMFPNLARGNVVPRAMLRQICDQLAELGCQEVAGLRELLD